MAENTQDNKQRTAGDGKSNRQRQRRKPRQPRPEHQQAGGQQKKPVGKSERPEPKERPENQDRAERQERKDRPDRNRRNRQANPRRTPRETVPIIETYEDILRDNARIEKEILLDIGGFSQISLDI